MSDERAVERLIAEPAELPLSAGAREAARRTIYNSVCLAVGAARSPAIDGALAALQSLGSFPRASVLGRSERLGVRWAALIGGMAVHMEDYDDTHLATVMHPGAPVVPAALALAEHLGAGAGALVEAVARGVELALRVGNALGRSHFDRGFHVTGTLGPLGAAAAASSLLGLEGEAVSNALGLAATRASGLQAALGTLTKPLHPGHAAAGGLQAASLAQDGFQAPRRWLTGPDAMAATMSRDFDGRRLTAGLGERWELESNTIKPYACGVVSHPVIEAARRLRAEGVRADEVVEIQATVNRVVLDVMGVTDPRDGLESKFSVYHCAAVGLIDDDGGPVQFSDARARAHDAAALRARVTVVCDERIPRDGAVLLARTTDGRAHDVRIDHANATSSMSAAELERKARGLIEPILGEPRAERLLARLRTLDGAEPVSALVADARPLAVAW